MEEQLKKLKSKAIISFILALLALTWQFINYTTIKEYITLDNLNTFEVVIMYSSYIFIIVLFLSIITLTYTIFRVSIKYNSEKKKSDKMISEKEMISSKEINSDSKI